MSRSRCRNLCSSCSCNFICNINNIIIKNIIIYDGTGLEPFAGEIRIKGEKITHVYRGKGVNQDSDAMWEGKVFVVEKLGSGTFLYLEKEGDPLVVETEGDSNIKVGDTVKVGFEASRCHIFDSSNQAFK